MVFRRATPVRIAARFAERRGDGDLEDGVLRGGHADEQRADGGRVIMLVARQKKRCGSAPGVSGCGPCLSRRRPRL